MPRKKSNNNSGMEAISKSELVIKKPTVNEVMELEEKQLTKIYEMELEQKLSQEYTFLRDIWDKIWFSFPQPDDISISKFKTLRRVDAFISQCYDFLVSNILSTSGRFYYDGKPEILEFVNKTFLSTDYLETGLFNAFRNMLTYLLVGFSVTEIVVDYSDKLGLYYIRKLITSDPERVSFHVDKHGNIINILISAIGKVGGRTYPLDMGGMVRLSPSKAIIITRRREFGNPYGESLFRPAYKYMLIKDFFVKELGIYLERLALPVREVVTTNPADKPEAVKVMNALHQGRSVISHAKSIEIKNIETASQLGHVQAFLATIDYCDRMIANSAGLDYTAIKGTYKGSVKRADYFINFEIQQRRILEDAINKAVKLICTINFGELDNYPEWHFTTGLKIEPAVLVQLMQVGAIKPTEDWIRMVIGAPPLSPELKAELEQRYNTIPILNPKDRDRGRGEHLKDEELIHTNPDSATENEDTEAD